MSLLYTYPHILDHRTQQFLHQLLVLAQHNSSLHCQGLGWCSFSFASFLLHHKICCMCSIQSIWCSHLILEMYHLWKHNYEVYLKHVLVFNTVLNLSNFVISNKKKILHMHFWIWIKFCIRIFQTESDQEKFCKTYTCIERN